MSKTIVNIIDKSNPLPAYLFTKEYYEDGTLKSEIPYADGYIEGEVLRYHKNGKLASKAKFQKNRQVEFGEAFDESGATVGILTDVLQYGPVDTWVFKTASGTLMAPALLAVFPQVDAAARRILVVAEKLREVAVYDH
jgi:hypothetical protein